MFKRESEKLILKAAKQFRAIAVIGPRQSGKTTVCKHLFKTKPYVSMEDQDAYSFAAENPKKFLSDFGKKGAVIDEVQKLPILFSYLQGILDKDNTAGQFVLTGSNNFLFQENITQSLAGRIYYVRQLTFSAQELAHNKLANDETNINILNGGYPEIFEKNLDKNMWFSSYINTYIERDIRQLRSVQNVVLFHKLLQLLAARCGQILNLNAIGNELNIDGKTVAAWVSLLQSSFIIYLLPPFYKNFNKRITKSPKVYFYDTGLLCHLLGIYNKTNLQSNDLFGSIYENYIVNEFVKHKENQGKFYDCYFWSEHNGNEVDLLIPNSNGLNSFEIKSSKKFKTDFTKQLLKLEVFSNSLNNKYIIYEGEERRTDHDIKCVNGSNLAKVIENL